MTSVGSSNEKMEVKSIEDVMTFFSEENERVLSKLQDLRLLPKEAKCVTRNCRRQCVLVKKQSGLLGYSFRCKKCRNFRSLRKGTFFSDSKLELRKIFMLMWLWASKSRVFVTANILNATKQSVVQQYRYFRDICSWKLINGKVQFQFGGVGIVVQLDKSLITKRKHDVDEITKREWIFGIYDTCQKRGMVIYMDNQESKTLTDIILEHVLPGTELWTDRWHGYAELSTLGGVSPYIHKTVKCSKNFIDPITGACTNQVEGYWSRLKRYARCMGVMNSKLLPEHIDQFMWLDVYGKSTKEAFDNLVMQIAEKYPLM